MTYLTAGLQNLKRQVNESFPDRDRKSDGEIGDTAHQARTSGHNRDDTAGSKPAWDGDPDNKPEVRAWDMDADLKDIHAQKLVDHIRTLPGVADVLRYIIFDRTMYHSRDGFAGTPYTGDNEHTEHAHFEGAWTQAADNNTTFDYHLEDITVPLTTADKKYIDEAIARGAAAAAIAAAAQIRPLLLAAVDDFLTVKIGDKANLGRTVGDVLRDAAKLRGVLVGDKADTANAKLPADSPLAKLLATAADPPILGS